MVKGFADDITVAQVMPSSFHIPVKFPTNVVPIYPLTVYDFWIVESAGAGARDGNSPHPMAEMGLKHEPADH